MIGWFVTAFWIVVFFVIAIIVTRCAVTRWRQYLIVFAFAALLVAPLYKFTGDISAVLPDWWSEGADGKDQIIFVSIAATILWPVILSAAAVWVVKFFILREPR